jgi:outer membrane lipoprotein SlyB
LAQGSDTEEPPLPPSTNPTNRALFPSQGQDQAQQLQDQLECYRWATAQTGWDPYVAYDALAAKGYVAEQSKESAAGGLVKGAVGGAAVGAAIGAIAGDTSKGAKIGALTGGLTKGSRSRRKNKSADKEMEAEIAAFKSQLEVWDRNYAACMQGHGYTVN